MSHFDWPTTPKKQKQTNKETKLKLWKLPTIKMSTKLAGSWILASSSQVIITGSRFFGWKVPTYPTDLVIVLT